jgi:hypothetical protein
VLLNAQIGTLNVRDDFLRDGETVRISVPLQLEAFGGESRKDELRIGL